METSEVIFCANQIYRNSLRLNCCFLVLVANRLYFFLKNLPYRKKTGCYGGYFSTSFLVCNCTFLRRTFFLQIEQIRCNDYFQKFILYGLGKFEHFIKSYNNIYKKHDDVNLCLYAVFKFEVCFYILKVTNLLYKH